MSLEKLINLRFIQSVSNTLTKKEQNAIDKTQFKKYMGNDKLIDEGLKS